MWLAAVANGLQIDGCRTYTVGVNECALPVELALVELAVVDNAIGKGEPTFALLPARLDGTHVGRLGPLVVLHNY